MLPRLQMRRLAALSGILFILILLAAVPAAAQDATTCEPGFRLFTHAMGETCIPENPQRVVVLDTGELDNALALGAPVVGAPVQDALQYQAYLKDQLDGITDTGTISEPNFEAILGLGPDLILGSKQRYEAIYDQLSQIAPTVLTESLRVPWQQNFQLHADALAKTAEAEQLLADYTTHIDHIRTALGDKLDTTTISIIRFRPSQVRLYLKSSYIGYILQDVGLKRPASQDQDVFSAEISLEQVQQADADYIFVTGYDVDDSERDTFLNSPLWQTLGAVQSGHTIDVNDDTWIAGLGVQAANLVVDDLEKLLAPSSAQAAACEPGFRLLESDLLASDPLCVPENPQRIAAVDTFTLETLLALGIKPVSGPFIETFLRDHQQFTDDLAGVIDTDFPVNREALLQADPDVIISIEPWIKDITSDLSAIAPTVSIQYNSDGDWQNIAKTIGAAVNQTDALDAAFAAYDERLATFKEQAEAAGVGDVSIVFLLPDVLYPFMGDTFSGSILATTDLSFPEALTEAAASGPLDDVSKERIDLLSSSDHIFLVTSGFSEEDLAAYKQLIATLEADPLWQSLPAFQAGKVHVVGRDWIGSSLIAAHVVLDDLFRSILGVEPAEVSPDPFLPSVEATPEASS